MSNALNTQTHIPAHLPADPQVAHPQAVHPLATQPQGRRYLSLWLPHWATDRWRLQQAERKGAAPPVEARQLDARQLDARQPVVAIASIGGRRLITAANEAAMTAQFTPGLSLADALARDPELIHIDADPLGDLLALRRLLLWCQRFSPLVTLDGADGLLIDIAGCAHLWQGEAGLRRDLLGRLRRRGFACRAGIADTIGAAWAAARFAPMSQAAQAASIIPPGEQKTALMSLPVDALRIDSGQAEALRRLGLRTIGDLYPLPRAALAKRIGRPLVDRLDQALGQLAEPFTALLPPPAHRVSLTFAEPIGTAEDLQRALQILAERLAEELAATGQGARRVRLSCYRLDHQVSEIGIGLSLPSATAKHVIDLLGRKIETIDPGPGIEQIMLSARRVEALRQNQTDLDQGSRIAAADLAPLIDRLGNRLGADRIFRFAPEESHLPERAVKSVPPLSSIGRSNWRTQTPPRPIRLLPHPEPIEAVAPIPDDPPLQFRWRHVLHRVSAAEGPERIIAEWWRAIDRDAGPSERQVDHPLDQLRDYYRVEDDGGRRFWLYRAGLYQPDQPPRWFLHGFLA